MTGRKRLSRQEAQLQTRERLIEAARSLFVQHGFAGTSLRDVAEEAGYSQGAFYSNFTCKKAVLLELLKRHVDLDDDKIAKDLATLSAWLEAQRARSPRRTLTCRSSFIRLRLEPGRFLIR